MAWNYCTKDEAISFAGLNAEHFQDEMSEIVESMIDDFEGVSFGDAVQYTETYDGNGSDTLVLDRKPIVAVSALSIDSSTMSASEYKVYGHYIRLVGGTGTSIKTAMGDVGTVFPVGQKNISVTYTANQSAIPGRVRFAAIQMLTVIALVHERGGSDAIIPATRAGQEFGANRTMAMDLSGKLRNIMEATLRERVLFA